MKRILLGILATATFGVATAQQNLDFEAWTVGAGYDDPDGWFTVNQYSLQGGPVTVFKEVSSPGEGTASASMVTTLCSACPLLGISDTLPGFVSQDVAFTATSIDTVAFKYLYNAVSGDEALAIVQLTKWNVIGDSADIIAEAAINLTDQSTWATMKMPMIYANSDTPDSLKILFTSSIAVAIQDYSYPQSQFGSDLKIDSIVLNGAPAPVFTSIFESTLEGVNVYANNNAIVINSKVFVPNTVVEIYSVTGKLISKSQLNSTSELVSTEEFTSGVYLVKISSENSVITKKVFVQ